ncbi:MAG TPA: hypothetical protein VFE88_04240 [Candidatus Nanoarchaeia archaeon]|nr:hypothetical protein [Candidatus Nanoarchaeia archaeon]
METATIPKKEYDTQETSKNRHGPFQTLMENFRNIEEDEVRRVK